MKVATLTGGERSIATMPYLLIEQAWLVADRRLGDFARRYGMTTAQVALAWLLAHDGVGCSRRR